MKSIELNEALRLCMAGELMSPSERAKLREERLRELVEYARENSLYFKELYKDIGNDYKLSDLPPTRKRELIQDYSKWVTDPEITKESVIDYIASDNSGKKLYLDKYSAITTSGTTGEPMPMVRDDYHNTIHGVMMQTRLLRDTDSDLMVPVNNKIASLIFIEPSVSSYSSLLRMKRAYPDHEDNVMAVSLDGSILSISKRLNDFQPDLITGYPSVMGAMAAAQKSGMMNISPKAIATSAEVLTPKVYNALKEAFDCPILNNYCSTEGGEAAMSCNEGQLHINDDWIIIEPVDENGNPTKDGEWSSGIYITDLTNFVQPIIRYYMEDKVKIHKEVCSCGNTLPVMEIMGRVIENVIVGGVEVMGVHIEHRTMYTNGVYLLQLVQKGPVSFELRLVPESENVRQSAFEEAKANLEALFKEYGCPPVEIKMSLEPPIHNKKGGKVRSFVKDF